MGFSSQDVLDLLGCLFYHLKKSTQLVYGGRIMKRVLMKILITVKRITSGCKLMGNDKAEIIVNDQAITAQELQDSVDLQLSSPF